jgi:iron complex outermembrane receptor protein
MFTRLRRRSDVESGFLQYSVMAVPNRLRLIGGTKLEHNGYTGFEYQPQVRAVWTPLKSHSFWTSVSRAIRVPSRGESDLSTLIVVPQAGPGGLPPSSRSQATTTSSPSTCERMKPVTALPTHL